MAWSHSTIKTRISSSLQDTAGSIFATTTDGEVDLTIKDCLREIAAFIPHVVRVIYQVESRSGSASSTSANHLVDATNSQFVSTDVGKTVYNDTDKTWAVITVYNSTSDVTISKDIFASGESYYIYNKGCHANNQINIEDVTDRIWIGDGDRLEYPIGTRRNIDDVEGDILTIGVEPAYVNDTAETDADKDVHVYFPKRHKVSQLTTLTGAVNYSGGYSAGATSMVLDGLQTSGTIEEGQEFTLAYRKEIYTVTADATIATNAATISFYPGLEAPVANDDVITFKKSTLTPILEPLFCQYVAAELMLSKSTKPLQGTINAISVLTTAATAIGNMEEGLKQAALDIESGREQADKSVDSITIDARSALEKIGAEVSEALDDLETGRALINTIPKGGIGVPSQYAQYANVELNTARGYLSEAEGYIRQAQADAQLSTNYRALAGNELSNAGQYLNQGIGYLRKIQTELAVAGSWRLYEEKGERLKAQVIQKLEKMVESRPYEIYQRT